MTSQFQQLVDTTGPAWSEGLPADKVYAAFTSSQTLHGGQESTLLAIYRQVAHFGGIIVPPGYTDPLKFVDGNPYGVSHATGADNDIPLGTPQLDALDHLARRARRRPPSPAASGTTERAVVRAQGTAKSGGGLRDADVRSTHRGRRWSRSEFSSDARGDCPLVARSVADGLPNWRSRVRLASSRQSPQPVGAAISSFAAGSSPTRPTGCSAPTGRSHHPRRGHGRLAVVRG